MAFIRNLGGLAAFALTLTAACGDNLKPPAEDAAPPPIDATRWGAPARSRKIEISRRRSSRRCRSGARWTSTTASR